MRDDIKNKINQALERHATRAWQVDERKRSQEDAENAFFAEFAVLRKDVIKPALQEIARFLQTGKFKINIYDHDTLKSADSKLTRDRLSIIFEIIPDIPQFSRTETPNFIIYTNAQNQTVRLSRSTMWPGRGGSNTSVGEVKIREVTRDLIHENIAEIVSEVFK